MFVGFESSVCTSSSGVFILASSECGSVRARALFYRLGTIYWRGRYQAKLRFHLLKFLHGAKASRAPPSAQTDTRGVRCAPPLPHPKTRHVVRLSRYATGCIGDEEDVVAVGQALDYRHREAVFRPQRCDDELLPSGLFHRLDDALVFP